VLKTQAQKLKDWLVHEALPFWAENAVDDHGGFYEYLALDGSPNVDAVRRVRVQARQIYVYALADSLGWYNGQPIVENTLNYMLDKGYKPDGKAGFVHLLKSDHTVHNPHRDLYDHAFYLLAALWSHNALETRSTKDLIENITTFITSQLHSKHGGWQEGIPRTLPRRQNPHMHLFEASLNAVSLTQDRKWLDLAGEIYKLFEARFFDPEHHIVREFFNEDWSLTDGPDGTSVEPGHGAEWIWLLGFYERLSGVDTSNHAARLYDKILKGSRLFLHDEEDVSGDIRRDTKRLWVQTELIKAHLAQAERGVPGAAHMAAAAIEGFRHIYLRAGGTWTDQINAAGQPIASTIPTSTFYHIICMISEAVRVSELDL
jgi:mannose-6-phosphate isomerase